MIHNKYNLVDVLIPTIMSQNGTGFKLQWLRHSKITFLNDSNNSIRFQSKRYRRHRPDAPVNKISSENRKIKQMQKHT